MWIHALLGSLCLSLALASPPGNRSDVSELIYNGVKELEPFAPLVAIIRTSVDLEGVRWEKAWCGGSILTPRHVLTAANCVDYTHLGNLTIYAGLAHLNDRDLEAPLVQRSLVAGVQVHPTANLAIFALETPFQYTDKIQPIRIFETFFHLGDFDTSATIYGFGDNRTPDQNDPWRHNVLLNRLDTQIVNQGECQRAWTQNNFPRTISGDEFCTKKHDHGVLGGDQGSPVIQFKTNYLTNEKIPVQIGVVSNYDQLTNDVPDIHWKVAPHCVWLYHNTQNTFVCL